MTFAIIGSAISVILVMWLTIYVTNKAYSRKWDQDDSDHPSLK